MSHGVKTLIFTFAGLTVVASICLVWFIQARHDGSSLGQQKVQVITNQISRSPMSNATTTPAMAGALANYPDFKMRPLAVSIESTNNQWTSADGKDTNIIRQLAHNPLEYGRMVDENSRILQRQLVYLKETAASVFEQAKLTGSTVTQLTLPGLGGQEMTFEIARREGGGSNRQGMFSGHLVGNADSLVTMAFEDGREAFTILSPKDNVFVVGEPRENGQVIVKAIDPNRYGVGPAPGDVQDVVKTAPANK